MTAPVALNSRLTRLLAESKAGNEGGAVVIVDPLKMLGDSGEAGVEEALAELDVLEVEVDLQIICGD